MKCRTCNFHAKLLYQTKKLPEYIWPKFGATKNSNCKVYECQNCFLLQLQNFSKKKIKSFYGKESFVITYKKKNMERINILKKSYGNNFFKKKTILDIGGGVNPILNTKNCDILDFQIAKNFSEKFKGKIIKGDVESNNLKKKYNLIFLLHTLEHLPKPSAGLKKINDIMHEDSLLILEVPNFDYFIKFRTHYAIFHQHLNMFNLSSLKNILSLNKLKIDKIFKNKEVIYCTIKKSNKIEKLKKIKNEKKLIMLKKNLENIEQKLKNKFKNKKIDFFGAGGSAALFLANFSFLKGSILNIYDKDIKKINKFLPGTSVKIKRNNHNLNKNYSISFYKLKKFNNFFVYS